MPKSKKTIIFYVYYCKIYDRKWISGEFDYPHGFHCVPFSHTNGVIPRDFDTRASQPPAIWCLTKHPSEIGYGRPSCSLSWQAGRRKRKRWWAGAGWVWKGTFGGQPYFSGQSIQMWMPLYQPTWKHKTSQIYRTPWTSFTSSCTCQSWVLSDQDE